MRALWIACLALPVLATDDPFYGPKARAEIEQALAAMNLTEADLGFRKYPSVGKARATWYQGMLPTVKRLLDHPLETPGTSQGIARDLMAAHGRGDVPAMLARAAGLLDLPEAKAPEAKAGLPLLDGLPGPLKDLVSEAALARSEVDAALSALTAEERAAIATETDADDEKGPPIGLLLGAWAKVDRARLLSAAGRLSAACARPLPKDLGPLDLQTPMGRVVVGSPGHDVHKGKAFVLVDPGGDDTYVGGAGAGLPVSVAIDLGGNDTYLPAEDRSPCQGAGLLGIGILLDAAGDDRYLAGKASQACGHFGVGILADEAGEDRYEGDLFCQGAGAYGAGLLLDRAGRDRYDAAEMAQAFAGVQGVGVLSDLDGTDVYLAGGKYDDAPLLPDRFACLSQGFSIGHRPEAAGGVAVLIDAKGNDIYQGDVYAQGTSYWLSLGILYDEGGNDHYSSVIYSQGAGVHLSVGCLLDQEGEDTYVCAHGVTQGSGHDFAVGCLVDAKGDDHYFADSFAQGAAGTNSVALLLDLDGKDQFIVRGDNTQGMGSGARDTLSVGMMLDLGGKGSQITARKSEGACALRRGEVGILRSDQEPPAPNAPPPPEQVTAVTEDDLDRLFALCARWEVGSNRAEVLGARQRMIEKGQASLDYLIPAKLDPENTFYMRTLRTVCQGLKEPAVKALLPQLESAQSKPKRAAAELLGSLGAQEAVPGLMKFLDDPDDSIKLRGMEILGGLKAKPAAPAVAALLKSAPSESMKIVAASALGSLGDGADALAACLEGEVATVRYTASRSLSRLGEAGVAKARELLASPSHQVRLHGIEILGWAKSEADRGTLLELTKEEDWTVRLYAVRALAPMKDDAVKARFAEMAQGEPNPYVKSALAE